MSMVIKNIRYMFGKFLRLIEFSLICAWIYVVTFLVCFIVYVPVSFLIFCFPSGVISCLANTPYAVIGFVMGGMAGSDDYPSDRYFPILFGAGIVTCAWALMAIRRLRQSENRQPGKQE